MTNSSGGERALISVVVPCFNEQDVIELTHQRLVQTLGGQESFELEIVYVDDGSSDQTPAILGKLAASDERVRVIELTRNFGHQAAVTAGLQFADGDAVVVIDADLQDPPEFIPTMIEKWRAGCEIVYAVRARRQEGPVKRAAYFLYYRFLRTMADIEIPLDSGDFALLDRKAVDTLNALPERNRFVRGLRTWIGYKQIGLPYERPARAAGEPKYTFIKLLNLGLNGLFSFSSKPLSLILLMGAISSALSAAAFVLYLVWRLTEIQVFGVSPADVPGFTSLVLLLLFFNAIQLVSIGIIGEYVGRVYDEVKERPTFLARGNPPTPHGRRRETSGRR